MSGSYKGDIHFESVLAYEKSGTFEPATKEHAQRNTPKPKKPSTMNEKSAKGLRDSIAYAVAAVEYAINTGDYSLIQQSNMDKVEQNYYLDPETKEKLEKVRNGKRWVDNAKFTYTLDTEVPDSEGEYYSWDRTFSVDYGAFEVNDGNAEELVPGGAKVTKKFTGRLLAEYKHGVWEVLGVVTQIKEEGEESTSSPSASSKV